LLSQSVPSGEEGIQYEWQDLGLYDAEDLDNSALCFLIATQSSLSSEDDCYLWIGNESPLAAMVSAAVELPVENIKIWVLRA
jgi:hypothetical protein